MALVVDIRFDSRPSNRAEQFWRGADIVAFAHFRDAETLEYVDVSGVSAIAYVPGGTELDPAPTVAEVSAGIWSLTIDADDAVYSGEWRIQANCTSPVAAVAVRDFTLTDPEPDEEAPPSVTYYSAVALVERAEAAQEAAESAASSSLGPMTATSVGGTEDGEGDVLTYTCTLPAVPMLGSEVDFTPTAPNAAGPRLRPTVASVLQSQVSIRDANGAAIGRRALVVGQNYRLHHDGTYWRLPFAVSPRITKTTSYSWIYAAPGDADDYGRVRLRVFEDGELLFDAGDGTSATGWASKWGFYDGAFRIYGAAGYLGGNVLGEDARILTNHFPPLTYENVKRVVGAPSRMNNRTSAQRISVPAGGYYEITGLDQHRDILVGNGAVVNFVHAPKGSRYNLAPVGSAVYHLYTGEGEWSGNGTDAATLTAHSWVNTGGKRLTTSAGAWVSVRRASSTFLAIAESGSVSAGTPALPAQDLVVAYVNQSWVVDLMMNGGAGAVRRLEEMGLGTDYCSVDSAPVGGSSWLYFAAKSALFIWDQRTDVPGRRLLDFVAAVQADQTARTTLQGSAATAVSMVVICEGLNGMGSWGPASTHPDNCPTKLTASYVKACQYIDAQLGANLLYVIVPLTSQKLGTFADSLWHSVRMAQLRAVQAGADAVPPVNIIIAPEIYGDPRSGDEEAEEGERHYDFPAHAVQMERIIDAWANETLSQSNYLGPYITGTATADSGAGIEWDVTIEIGTGRAFNQATRPEAAGFRLLPAATGDADTDDFATPLTILATRWVAGGTATTIKLRVTLSEAYLAGTPRPSVLWGSAAATDQIECVIYALHPVTSKRMYLRQYLSGG